MFDDIQGLALGGDMYPVRNRPPVSFKADDAPLPRLIEVTLRDKWGRTLSRTFDTTSTASAMRQARKAYPSAEVLTTKRVVAHALSDHTRHH